jgi:hypothetical protein
MDGCGIHELEVYLEFRSSLWYEYWVQVHKPARLPCIRGSFRRAVRVEEWIV